MYTVRASDAHAWVEVYFAGVGWVAFEPTPGFAAPNLAGVDSGAASAGQSADAAEQGLAAAGNSAADGAAAGARGLAGRAAAQLQAAAVRAADAAERGAHALAQAARSAASARPWAMAALAAGATGAAGLAAAAWRRRERDAFARALHKYRQRAGRGPAHSGPRAIPRVAEHVLRELDARPEPDHRIDHGSRISAALMLPPHIISLIAEFVRWTNRRGYGSEWTELPVQAELSNLREAIQSMTPSKQSKSQGAVPTFRRQTDGERNFSSKRGDTTCPDPDSGQQR